MLFHYVSFQRPSNNCGTFIDFNGAQDWSIYLDVPGFEKQQNEEHGYGFTLYTAPSV